MTLEFASQAVLFQLDSTLRLINAFSPSLSVHQILYIQQGLAHAQDSMGVALELRYLTDGITFACELDSFFSTSCSIPTISANPDHPIVEDDDKILFISTNPGHTKFIEDNGNKAQSLAAAGSGLTTRGTKCRQCVIDPEATIHCHTPQQLATSTIPNGDGSSTPIIIDFSGEDSSAGTFILILWICTYFHSLSRDMTAAVVKTLSFGSMK